MDAMLDDAVDVPVADGQRAYRVGRLPSLTGSGHVVAVVLMPAMGNNLAATYAVQLVNDFPKLRELVFVGIAGAAPNPTKIESHVRLGDVVVSGTNGVIQYDMLKQDSKGAQFRGSPRPPSSLLLKAVRHLEAAELMGSRSWLENLARTDRVANTRRPAESEDRLEATPPEQGLIVHPADPTRLPGQPRLFVGTIGSANILLKDAVKRDALRDQHDVRAFEMEGSGVADACWATDRSYFVVRGTCDYCDPHKNDVWQGYAAAIAAACLRGILALCSASESTRAAARPLLDSMRALRRRVRTHTFQLKICCWYIILAIAAGATTGAALSQGRVSYTLAGMFVGALAGVGVLVASQVLQKAVAARDDALYLHRALANRAGTSRAQPLIEEAHAFLGR